MASMQNRDDQPVLLTVRPRRIAVLCTISATIVLAAMIVVGLLLIGAADGVAFRRVDQVGLILVGVLMAGAIMLMARPRLQVTATGLWVRGVLAETFVPWPVIHKVAFPPGANWAQVELADDEVRSVMAIQAIDRNRAVDALRTVRELHMKYGTPRSTAPSPEYLDQLLRAEQQRPLGKLEIIDRERSGPGDRAVGHR